MPHPLVLQLRFARDEFKRGLAGLTNADARRRFEPMNCISWNLGHMAWQEQRYWLCFGEGKILLPSIQEQFANSASASTPSFDEVWGAWHEITRAADPWLDRLTTQDLQQTVIRDGKPSDVIYGSLLLRVTYHYWYHAGENLAIRQLLGHTDLPEFVGDLDGEAPYRPEASV